MARDVSVILIREASEQLTGSGCCGKLEGDSAAASGAFAQVRTHQQSMGVLHRTVRGVFAQAQAQGRLEIVTVDPRNQLYLAAKLARDVWKYRPGWRTGLRVLSQAFRLPAVVVNGEVLDGGPAADPDALCHAISERLGAANGSSAAATRHA
jgi:hypothetical protein